MTAPFDVLGEAELSSCTGSLSRQLVERAYEAASAAGEAFWRANGKGGKYQGLLDRIERYAVRKRWW
jgi:hypothetical protein